METWQKVNLKKSDLNFCQIERNLWTNISSWWSMFKYVAKFYCLTKQTFWPKLFWTKVFWTKFFWTKFFWTKCFWTKMFLNKMFLSKLVLNKIFLNKMSLTNIFDQKIEVHKLSQWRKLHHFRCIWRVFRKK